MSSPAGGSNQQPAAAAAATTSNLLSPNAALEQVTTTAAAGQRRKSTLSGNGFFIDYSCTRRRSSAAVRQTHHHHHHQQQQQQLQQHQYGGAVSPVWARNRQGGGSFCAGSQPRPRACSRAALCSPTTTVDGRLSSSSMLLVPPLYAPSALAGSRKTSIFDAAGHSLSAAHLRSMRRKSTMVTSMPAAFADLSLSSSLAGGARGQMDPADSLAASSTCKMLSLAKSAAAAASRNGGRQRGGSGQFMRRSQLVRDHVPVIGCSPTSIRASLAALDETRRYEKLLKKLKQHEKSRLKRDKKRLKRKQNDTADLSPRPAMSFRRKSLRAIKDAAALLGNSGGGQAKQQAGAGDRFGVDDTIEDLSVSSMSLSNAFEDQASMRRGPDDDDSDDSRLSRLNSSSSSASYSSSTVEQCYSLDDDQDDHDDSRSRSKRGSKNKNNDNDESDDDDEDRYELNNDELFLDDNTLVNFNELPPPGGQIEPAHRANSDGERRTKSANGKSSSASGSLVKLAMRRLTGGSTRGSRPPCRGATKRNSTAPDQQQQIAGGGATQQNADYWHYYYYLRENSLDAIDDLPIGLGESGGGGGCMANTNILSDGERRIRLHMNYSLARIEILNDCGGGGRSARPPTTHCGVEKELAPPTPAAQDPGQQQSVDEDPGEHLFDQASEVSSLSLSTSSSCTPRRASALKESSSLDDDGDGAASRISHESVANGDSSSAFRASASDLSALASGSGSASASSSPTSPIFSSSKSSLEHAARKSLSPQSRQIGWQRQQSMSSQSVAVQKLSSSAPPPLPVIGGRTIVGGEFSTTTTTAAAGGNSADDECTSVECLMDRNRLSPSPMRPQSADMSLPSRKHRSASGELPAAAAADAAASAAAAAGNSEVLGRQNQRRSASFRGHRTAAPKHRPAATVGVDVPELDDFERFRRAHRPGYDLNGELQQRQQQQQQQRPVPAIDAPPTRPPSGRVRRSHLRSSVRSARGSSSCNLANNNNNNSGQLRFGTTNSSWILATTRRGAPAVGSSSSTNTATATRTSMSWDTLNSAWPDKEQGTTASAVGAPGGFSPFRVQGVGGGDSSNRQPVSVKRTNSARFSSSSSSSSPSPSRQRERPQTSGSHSNPTRGCNQSQQQQQQQLQDSANLLVGGAHGTEARQQQRQCHNDNYDVQMEYQAAAAGLNDHDDHDDGEQQRERRRHHGGGGQMSLGAPIISPTSGRRRGSIVNLGPLGVGAGRDDGDDDERAWQVQAAQQRQQQQSRQRFVVGNTPPVARRPHGDVESWRPMDAQTTGGRPNMVTRSNETAAGSRLEAQAQETATATAHRVRAHSTGANSTANQAAATFRQPTRAAAAAASPSNAIEPAPLPRRRQHVNSNNNNNKTDSTSNRISGENKHKINYYDQHQQQPSNNRNYGANNDKDETTTTTAKNTPARAADLQLLAKNSFTCLIIGSRQTGKRTIVKCFVKLVNEFRLAADEYRKEKILTKLMDCRERLQVLAAKQQAEQEEADQREADRHHQSGNRRRSRVNSWFGGKLLPHLPAAGKLRLHSLVPGATPSSASALSVHQLQQQQQQQQQRRYTAIEPGGGFSLCGGGAGSGTHERASFVPASAAAAHHQLMVRDGVGRHSTKERRRPTEFLLPGAAARLNCCNKSDFNINYLDTDEVEQQQQQQPRGASVEYIVMNQLQIPSSRCESGSVPSIAQLQPLNTSTCSLGKQTNISFGDSSTQVNAQAPAPIRSRRSTQICIDTGDDRTKTTTTSDRHPHPHHRRRHHRKSGDHHHHHHHRRHRARQTTVSLKEINRRRIRVRFSTRRQLSDKYLNYLTTTKSVTNSDNGSKSESENHDTQLPDSIMVVYSVNDRESFDYAKTLIGQLRSIREKRECLLPIILVANKIDLERAKVVRPEEGQALAKRNECKYMEISCTVGFKLDNLLVGLRTQLVLKHHTTLNLILRGNSSSSSAAASKQGRQVQEESSQSNKSSKKSCNKNSATSGNILVRFYKRYVMDDSGRDFDWDNFSKL